MRINKLRMKSESMNENANKLTANEKYKKVDQVLVCQKLTLFYPD